MVEPIWAPAPANAPRRLFDALPTVPPLVVHLAARRLRAASSRAADGDGSADDWPDVGALHDFLFPSPTAPLPACGLPRLAGAAARLALAVQRREAVGIHGDYDVDGVTSTALLATWLSGLGLPVETVLPTRTRGYGLSTSALEALAARGCRVVIAVDCGVTAVAEALRARELGLELIVLDHHVPGPDLPDAAFLIGSKLPDADGADHCLAAVGLAYRLCEAMVGAGAGDERDLARLLDLVALGTIADVCPLTGQNRLLVLRGLATLRTSGRPGVVALASVARLQQAHATADDVAFRLAPRLNAAGRLADPRLAFDLLMTDDPTQAAILASELERLNRERQRLTEGAVSAAIQQLGSVNGAPKLLFAIGRDWPEGIVGLVAGKLAERYHRPAVAVTATAGGYSGSARSIDGFDIAASLLACHDLLIRGGGHARAAGLTLETAALEPLRLRLQRLAEEQIDAEQLRPQFVVEAKVRLKSLTPELLHAIDRLGPFGEGNRPPLLQADRVTVAAVKRAGKERQHLQLRLRQGTVLVKAVQFGIDPATLPLVGADLDVLFVPQLDRYDGDERVELRVTAIRGAV